MIEMLAGLSLPERNRLVNEGRAGGGMLRIAQ